MLVALRAASRNGGSTTAHALAEELGISVRTIYRDLDVLRTEGVSIAGRTGVGLRLEEALEVEARVRASAAGIKAVAEDPAVLLDQGGKAQVLRAATKEALLQAVLRSLGEIEIVSPDKLRRELRELAREIARKHKD